MRKIISQVIKRIMDQCDKDHCDKISKVVTGAEGNVVQAMHSQIDRKWSIISILKSQIYYTSSFAWLTFKNNILEPNLFDFILNFWFFRIIFLIYCFDKVVCFRFKNNADSTTTPSSSCKSASKCSILSSK